MERETLMGRIVMHLGYFRDEALQQLAEYLERQRELSRADGPAVDRATWPRLVAEAPEESATAAIERPRINATDQVTPRPA